MPLADVDLQGIVGELASQPGHPKVAALIHRLLTDGLGARSTEIDFERPLPEVRGKADALLGRTVFEFKSNLRRESADAEAQLPRYLAQREAETRERFVGIATDGASYAAYETAQREPPRASNLHRFNGRPTRRAGMARGCRGGVHRPAAGPRDRPPRAGQVEPRLAPGARGPGVTL